MLNEVKKMDTINNRLLVFAFLVFVMFFLYFGNGIIMSGGISGRMNGNGWISSNNWLWYLTVTTISIWWCVSWLHFKKKI